MSLLVGYGAQPQKLIVIYSMDLRIYDQMPCVGGLNPTPLSKSLGTTRG